jgi:predicted glycosyltransferase involved in capsule biosynthesis
MKKDVCIIIPYRDRAQHLSVLVPQLNSILTKENLSYDILVVEQSADKIFNRGKIKNIGFDYSKGKYKNYVFHDVDMIPIEEKSSYAVVETPTHYAAIVEQFGWSLAYATFAGGVIAFDEHSFVKANGYANDYVGWGAEDDDLYYRCKKNDITVMRRHNMYSSLQHSRELVREDYQHNLNILQKWEDRMQHSGLSDLEYKLISESQEPGNKHILVEI